MSDKVAYRDALPPGTRLREFELLEVLGRGGFGITYRGWYPNLGVNVAIKEYMPSEFAVREPNGDVYPKTRQSEEWYRWGLDKFLEEAKTLLRFNHPSIVRVLQFFEGHGTAYMVMEYLEGRTLFALLHEEKTLSEARLRALIKPILDGLEQVHAAGYLHRDIKPGNIVFRDEDTPVLIDFGAAYALTAEHSRTVAAFEMPGFSPIEQYSVTGQNYGPWTDLYAVGAVLYRSMTELVPIGAPSRIERDDLAPVDRVAKRKYGKQLTGAVDWALKLRAADRPQSIAQWRRVLEGQSRPPGSDTGSIGRVSGKLLAMIVMAATLVIAAGAWWMFDSGVEEKTTRVRELIEEGEIAEARRVLEEARALGLTGEPYEVLWVAIIDQMIARVRNLVTEGKIAEARHVLEEARAFGLHSDLYQTFSAAIDEADNGAAPVPATRAEPSADPGVETPNAESIDQKIARVRNLVTEGKIAEARRVLEEARALGLPDDMYQTFSAAVDEADDGAAPAPDPQPSEDLAPERPESGEDDAVQSLSGCDPLESEQRWEEALECVRQVMARDEDNAEAREKERNLEMLAAFSRVHDAPSVEGYYQFIKDFPWSNFVDAAGEGLKELEFSYWEDVKATDTPDSYRRYLEIYPAGRHADEARSRLSGGG